MFPSLSLPMYMPKEDKQLSYHPPKCQSPGGYLTSGSQCSSWKLDINDYQQCLESFGRAAALVRLCNINLHPSCPESECSSPESRCQKLEGWESEWIGLSIAVPSKNRKEFYAKYSLYCQSLEASAELFLWLRKLTWLIHLHELTGIVLIRPLRFVIGTRVFTGNKEYHIHFIKD